jgi:hypothetical protein
VTAFACMTVQSVGQRDYLLEGQQLAAPKMHSHELQRAHSPPKECSSPAWQIGQTT